MGPAQQQVEEYWDGSEGKTATAIGGLRMGMNTKTTGEMPGPLPRLNVELDDAISLLHLAIEDLRDKLAPVTAASPLADQAGMKEPSSPEAYSPMGSRLMDNYYSIKRATRYISEIKRDLEL